MSCSSDSGSESSSCEEGQVVGRDGQCVDPDLDTGDRDTEVDTEVADVTDSGATDSGATDILDPDVEEPIEIPCMSNATRCGESGIPQRCEGSEWVDQAECASGSGCLVGECVPNAGCEVGDVRGCVSQTERLICNDAGNNYDRIGCADGEFCFAGLCGQQRCEPMERACDMSGTIVLVCGNDGTRWFEVESCEAGEACSQGQCVSACVDGAKDPTYIGCEYWSVDLPQQTDEITQDTAERAHHAVVLANMGDRTAVIEVETESGIELIDERIEIAVGEVGIVEFPRADLKFTSRSMNSFRISTSQPVVAYQFNPLDYVEAASNDASLLLPSDTLGLDYWVMSWPSGVKPFAAAADTAQTGGFSVVSTSEGTTTVEITFSATLIDGETEELQGIVAGDTRTFTMSRYEVLTFEGLTPSNMSSVGDLTGSRVIADQAVAVFGWHEQAVITVADACCAEHMEQQLFPTTTWGSHYVAVHSPTTSSEPDTWRIMASEDGTLIHTRPAIPNLDGAVLNAGEFVEATAFDPFEIEATRPVLVGQFLHSADGFGDPAFVLAVPVEQYLSAYTVLSPDNFRESYITIIRSAGIPILLDGVLVSDTSFRSFGSGQYEYSHQEVQPGAHRLLNESNIPFAVMIFGYDSAVSYGVPGGLALDATDQRIDLSEPE